MDPVISVRGLRKTYGGVVAVEDVGFEVRWGEIFGIIGPNGAGKTTTVECLQGLRRADGGELAVLGLDPRRDASRLRRRIGAQLQESALPDRIKVWEALDLFASLGTRRGDWESLLAAWGLEGKRGERFGRLSGGQQQRLFVALALVNDPELVFLDEMTTGLDPAARRVTWDLVERIRERGTTVVLVTHFMDEAERLCDRIAVIDRRTVRAVGAPGELIDRFAPEVRVRFSAPLEAVDWLEAIEGADGVVRHPTGGIEVTGTGPLLARVAAALAARGHLPADLRVDRATLEDVFLRITGGVER